MGTRNLLVLKKNGEYKAKYCQWDGYPSGQGASTLTFLREHSVEEIGLIFEKLVPISKDEVESIYKKFGNIETDEKCNAFKRQYPSITRDFGGGEFLKRVSVIEDYVPFYNDIEFAANSLFCGWVYVIDLDEGVFDVYAGFNTEKLGEKERFAFLAKTLKGNSEYQPVKFKVSWLLSHLPTVEEFLKVLEDEE